MRLLLLMVVLCIPKFVEAGGLQYSLVAGPSFVHAGDLVPLEVVLRNTHHRPITVLKKSVMRLVINHAYKDGAGGVQEYSSNVIEVFSESHSIKPFSEIRFAYPQRSFLSPRAQGGVIRISLGGMIIYTKGKVNYTHSLKEKASTWVLPKQSPDSTGVKGLDVLSVQDQHLLLPRALAAYDQDPQRVVASLVARLKVDDMRNAALFSLSILTGKKYTTSAQWHEYMETTARKAKAQKILKERSRQEFITSFNNISLTSSPWVLQQKVVSLAEWEQSIEFLHGFEEAQDDKGDRELLRWFLLLYAGDEQYLDKVFGHASLQEPGWGWQKVLALDLLQPLEVVSQLSLAWDALHSDDQAVVEEGVIVLGTFDRKRLLDGVAVLKKRGWSSDIQQLILRYIGKLSNKREVDLVIELSKSADKEVANRALKLLNSNRLRKSDWSSGSGMYSQDPPKVKKHVRRRS